MLLPYIHDTHLGPVDVEQGVDQHGIELVIPGERKLITAIDEQWMQGVVFIVLHLVKHSLDAATTSDAGKHLRQILEDFLSLDRQRRLFLD